MRLSPDCASVITLESLAVHLIECVRFSFRAPTRLLRAAHPRPRRIDCIHFPATLREMSDLTFMEKRQLEKLFGMSSGYVLDFSNNTLTEFVADSVGRNIYDSKYDYSSGSKANRLRAFWTVEPNHLVANLLTDFLHY